MYKMEQLFCVKTKAKRSNIVAQHWPTFLDRNVGKIVRILRYIAENVSPNANFHPALLNEEMLRLLNNNVRACVALALVTHHC